MIVALLAAALLPGCAGASPTQTVQTQSFRVALTLDAARYGDRTATVELADLSGEPVSDAQVVLVPTMPSDGMASPEAVARPVGPGRYQAPGAVAFTMIGEWRIETRINAGEKEEVAVFMVQVAR